MKTKCEKYSYIYTRQVNKIHKIKIFTNIQLKSSDIKGIHLFIKRKHFTISQK